MTHLPSVDEQPVPRNIELRIPVPDWAKWLAQDADGCWCIYAERPVPSRGRDEQWVFASDTPVAQPMRCVYVGEPNPNWRDTLMDLTEEQ